MILTNIFKIEPEEIDVFMVNEECLARPNFSFVESYEKEEEVLEDFWYGKAASLDSVHCLPPREPQTREPRSYFIDFYYYSYSYIYI